MKEFMSKMLSTSFIASVRVKTLVVVFKAVADVWTSEDHKSYNIRLTNDMKNETIQALYKLLFAESIVFDYRVKLLDYLSVILANTEEANVNNKSNPIMILETLILYVTTDEMSNRSEKHDIQDLALQQWLLKSNSKNLLETIA